MALLGSWGFAEITELDEGGCSSGVGNLVGMAHTKVVEVEWGFPQGRSGLPVRKRLRSSRSVLCCRSAARLGVAQEQLPEGTGGHLTVGFRWMGSTAEGTAK